MALGGGVIVGGDGVELCDEEGGAIGFGEELGVVGDVLVAGKHSLAVGSVIGGEARVHGGIVSMGNVGLKCEDKGWGNSKPEIRLRLGSGRGMTKDQNPNPISQIPRTNEGRGLSRVT